MHVCPALKTCSDSVRYFIGVNAEKLRCKGACRGSQTDPLDAALTALFVFSKYPSLMYMTGKRKTYEIRSAKQETENSTFIFANT